MQPSSESSDRLQPLRNPRYRHISRSAAKRESVQLLGSIKDLQAHFARIDAEHKAGVGAGIRGLSSLGEEGEAEGDGDDGAAGKARQPSGAVRSRESLGIRPPLAVLDGENVEGARRSRERRPWKEVELHRVDVQAAKLEVQDLLAKLKSLWCVEAQQTPTSSERDTRDILVTTAQAVRRVRTLALSISHGQTARRQVSGSSIPRLGKGPSSISTPSRPAQIPRAVSSSAVERKTAFPSAVDDSDHLGELRKAALDVLSVLRKLEEEQRIRDPSDASGGDVKPDHSNRQSAQYLPQAHELDESESLNPLYTSDSSAESGTYYTAATTIRPGSSQSQDLGRDEPEALDIDEDYNLNALAQAGGEGTERLVTWEERIVSEGREYLPIGADQPLAREQEIVDRWFAVVDGLFGDSRAVRQVPVWAKEQEWEGRPIERLLEFLNSNLSMQLQALLPPASSPNFQSDLLDRLSDGYMLIQAFNAAVMSSTKPWGFVAPEDQHDTLASIHTEPLGETEMGEKSREWTFMRAGNLTAWAAALKLRYNIPLNVISATPALLSVPQVPMSTTDTATADSSRKSSPHPPGRSLGQATSVSKRPAVILSSAANAPNTSIAAAQSRGSTSIARAKPVLELIDFDAGLVARRSGDWARMLDHVLQEWLKRAADEELRAATRI